ncbi:MAG: 50S ribosomal protein L17 [Coriobacteriales bacterium]|jgi:large subunit ribosomal protein L17
MRHQKKHGLKLGTDAAHTRAMKRSLVCSLFLNDRIKTTETRAKAIRGDVDRVITWAKRGDLHSRRLAIAKLNDKEIVREVFEKVQQGMWSDRTCGFTRIYKLGPRRGDNSPMVIMELVTEPVQPKKKGAKDEKATASEVKPVEAEAEEKADGESAAAAETAAAPEADAKAETAPAEEAPASEEPAKA